ncbi:hypothetical protein ADK67_32740 [Saccharothrix sp. NRRL B-16348]|nr:hypothetical protein [Saccharothrix sp. NRRL B-16348]KOX19711.1 hypothetical protein ADK67_32740 [Saccharothrix sp. NRRL B-16348]
MIASVTSDCGEQAGEWWGIRSNGEESVSSLWACRKSRWHVNAFGMVTAVARGTVTAAHFEHRYQETVEFGGDVVLVGDDQQAVSFGEQVGFVVADRHEHLSFLAVLGPTVGHVSRDDGACVSDHTAKFR